MIVSLSYSGRRGPGGRELSVTRPWILQNSVVCHQTNRVELPFPGDVFSVGMDWMTDHKRQGWKRRGLGRRLSLLGRVAIVGVC